MALISTVKEGTALFGTVGIGVVGDRLNDPLGTLVTIDVKGPRSVELALFTPVREVRIGGTLLMGTKEADFVYGGTEVTRTELTMGVPSGATTAARLANNTTVFLPGVLVPVADP